jgi:hypothetical protein
MGYFEGLADAIFKQDSNGETVFYPWGVLGKGRIIRDPATRDALRNFIMLYYKVSLPLIVLLVVFRLWWLAALAFPLMLLWFVLKSRELLKDCPPSSERLTLREGYRNSAASHNSLTLWLLLIVSLLFCAGSVLLLVAGKPLFGIFGLVLFGACSGAFVYMIKAKRERR